MAGATPPWPTAALRPIFGERRGLPKPRAPRGIELLSQPLVLPLQPIALTLRPRQLLVHAREFFCLMLDQLIALVIGRTGMLIDHTRFMADSRKKYKYLFVSLAVSPAKRRRIM